MAIVSTYSAGIAPTTTLSRYFSTLDELLVGLPDNSTNAIQAINVRDVAYTLYQYTNSVVASSSVTASLAFVRSSPSTYLGNVGGVPQGTTFSGSIIDVLDSIFYPYVAPSASFLSISDREFGQNNVVGLNWSVVKNSNTITTISVDGNPIVPTGNSQSSITSTIGTHSLTPGVTESNVFSIVVSDGTSTITESVSLTWKNRIFWGSVDLSSIGNPNLTFFPGSASVVATLCTDSVIRNLSGANANGSVLGSQLAIDKSKVYNGIDGSGDYLVFAWPTNFTNSTAPQFVVNGAPNTAFTRVRTNSPLINQWGFNGTRYEVWVSNTRQYSPLNIIIT